MQNITTRVGWVEWVGALTEFRILENQLAETFVGTCTGPLVQFEYYKAEKKARARKRSVYVIVDQELLYV